MQNRQYQLRLLIRFFQIIRPLRSFSLLTEPAPRGSGILSRSTDFTTAFVSLFDFTTKRRCCQWNMARRQRKSDGNLCIRLDIRQKSNKYRKIIDFRNRCDPVPFSVFSVQSDFCETQAYPHCAFFRVQATIRCDPPPDNPQVVVLKKVYRIRIFPVAAPRRINRT